MQIGSNRRPSGPFRSSHLASIQFLCLIVLRIPCHCPPQVQSLEELALGFYGERLRNLHSMHSLRYYRTFPLVNQLTF